MKMISVDQRAKPLQPARPHDRHVGIFVRALVGQLEDSIGHQESDATFLRILPTLKLHPDGQGIQRGDTSAEWLSRRSRGC